MLPIARAPLTRAAERPVKSRAQPTAAVLERLSSLLSSIACAWNGTARWAAKAHWAAAQSHRRRLKARQDPGRGGARSAAHRELPGPLPLKTPLLTRARRGARRTAAREELRLQVGTLRFDLNALAEGKDKASRKKALGLKADFLKKARPPARRRRFPCAWESLAMRRSTVRACRRAGEPVVRVLWPFGVPEPPEQPDKVWMKRASQSEQCPAAQADELDYALRMKNETKAAAALTATKSALDVMLQAV